jgi:hypothetical protein
MVAIEPWAEIAYLRGHLRHARQKHEGSQICTEGCVDRLQSRMTFSSWNSTSPRTINGLRLRRSGMRSKNGFLPMFVRTCAC